MKKIVPKAFVGALIFSVILAVFSAKADSVSYNGTISSSTLGSSVATTLPMFNAALGTLTGVQVTLDFTVTPYAQILNYTGSPRTFDSGSWTSLSYSPSDIWTISYGTDIWNLTAPTVATGNIYGTGQVVPNAGLLTFVGGASAPANLTAASGVDFSAYTGGSTLTFGTSGAGQFYGGGAFYSGSSFGGGGGLGLLAWTGRARRRNLSIKPCQTFTGFRG